MCYLWPEAAQRVEMGARQLGMAAAPSRRLAPVACLGCLSWMVRRRGSVRHTHARAHTHTHTYAHILPQERCGEVELTRPWSYQDFREALLEDFVREVVLPCAAEAAEVERQRSGMEPGTEPQV